MAVNRVIFFVHMVPRFVTDFGAVARYVVHHGIPAAVFSLATRSDSSAGWAQPEIAERYLAALPEGVKAQSLPLDRERPDLIGLIRTSILAFSLARRAPDTVFMLWTVMVNIVCGLPLRVLQRRCVFLVPGGGSILGSDTRKYRLLRPIVTRLYAYLFSGRNSRVIVHNHEIEAFFRKLGVDEDHIAVTPGCGVDPEEFPFSSELPRNVRKIILVPVRLMREKGVLDAARASDVLRARGLEHEMWFSCSVDPGNPSSLTPEEILQVQQDSPSTRFVGYQPSLIPLYEASDVVCVPTRYPEGLPTVLLEAAACGRPIVATDNVGCREFIEDGRTGLMAPVGSPTGLAEALARVLTDEPLADRLRRNAYDRYLAGFTKTDMLAITIDVLRDLDLQVPRVEAGVFT
jgi:glycosyltransferase involved in cell wall biosynthesis